MCNTQRTVDECRIQKKAIKLKQQKQIRLVQTQLMIKDSI